MFTTFFDKLSGIFDRRYLVTYWSPTMLGVMLALALLTADVGIETVAQWWDSRAGTQQFMLGLSLLFITGILAYLLQALGASLLKLYEGSDEHPTPLGRILAEAEACAQRIYVLDGGRLGVWWPRLLAVLPEERRNRVDDAFAALVALLNLCTIFLIWAFAGGAYAAWRIQRPIFFMAVYLGGLLLAWLCYRGALMRARNFADLMGAVFDFHRHDVLKAMHIPLPDSLSEERVLWYKLNQLAYNNLFPWDKILSDEDKALPEDPFYYDHYKPPAPPSASPKPNEVRVEGEVTLRGTPTILVRGKGVR